MDSSSTIPSWVFVRFWVPTTGQSADLAAIWMAVVQVMPPPLLLPLLPTSLLPRRKWRSYPHHNLRCLALKKKERVFFGFYDRNGLESSMVLLLMGMNRPHCIELVNSTSQVDFLMICRVCLASLFSKFKKWHHFFQSSARMRIYRRK